MEYWAKLDNLIKSAVERNTQTEFKGAYGLTYRATPFELPSMSAQHPGSVSMALQIILPDGTPYVTRFVHGLYFKGNKLCYYRAKDNLHEELWAPTYKHPKLKNSAGKPLDVYYSIYGGKLAAIFTQSMCREIFFNSLTALGKRLRGVPNALIVGQFHDEINIDWWPSEEEGAWTKEQVVEAMSTTMSSTVLEGFPLEVDIKSSYRYIK